jgi:pimeloyl-ACP methyl ester carboxylesterase
MAPGSIGVVIKTAIAPHRNIPAAEASIDVENPNADIARIDARLAVPGGTLAYTAAGVGEVLLLIHGLGGTRRTWRHIIDRLAVTHRVIAPDLPGHGESDAPAGDYSLGAHASALRDLLVALGHHSVTVVGHSLGGGIGMQFAYQFPERTNRLILISSGGLGPELTPMLRAATLPGAQTVVAGLAQLPERIIRRLIPVMSVVPGVVARQDAGPLAEGLRGLADRRQRHAFIRTARSVINWRGQRVSASTQLSLLGELPVLVVWGSRDETIPPRHHRLVIHHLPEACLTEIPGAGHYPHETDSNQILRAMNDFLAATEPFHCVETQGANSGGDELPDQLDTPLRHVRHRSFRTPAGYPGRGGRRQRYTRK